MRPDAYITYGAMAAPISRQLDVPKALVAVEEKAARAAIYLGIHDFLTDAERRKVLRRITRSVSDKMRGTK